MPSDDSSGSRPAAPIVLRIKLRYDDVDAMVQRFASNVGKSGLFLPTKSIQPLGAEIKFELRLADDTPALVGLGRVKSATPPDPHNPRATFGMAIELMRVTPQSRALILRMLEHRRAQGLPEVGLPTAEDIEAARRAEAAAVAREPASGPLPVVPASRIEPHPGEALLTAPRRPSGPIAMAKILAVAPLAPEPPRRKRLAISEVIESASGPVARVSVAVPGIDDEVDIGAALSRARRLAGDSLDAELEALCEMAAAPLEISIEAASAELARQLGGSAVRRDRSARWAPPPATMVPAPAAPAEVAAPAEPAEACESRAELRHGSGAVPEPIGDAGVDEPPPPRTTGEHHEVEPGQIADEIHQLHDHDLEDIERTETGDIPVAAASFEHSFTTEPSVADQLVLAARLEAQLVEAEADADDDDRELIRALTAAQRERAGDAERTVGEPALDVSLEEIDDFEILSEADADDEDGGTAHGEQDASDSGDAITPLPAAARAPSEQDFAARLDLGDEGDLYYALPAGEFSARHVLDALPDDLAGQDDAFVDEPRLESHLESARQALAAFDTGDEPLDDSEEPTGTALEPAVRPIFEPEPSNSFPRMRASSDSIDLDVPMRRSEPAAAGRAARVPAPGATKEPAILRGSPFLSLLDSPVEDYELEHALEALDVDLDDLAIPHAATQLQRDVDPAKSRPSATIRPAPTQPRTPQPHTPQPRTPQPHTPQPHTPQPHTPQPHTPQPGTPQPQPSPQPRAPAATPSRPVRQTGPVPAPASSRPPRVTTEDGVLIDFDDDE